MQTIFFYYFSTNRKYKSNGKIFGQWFSCADERKNLKIFTKLFAWSFFIGISNKFQVAVHSYFDIKSWCDFQLYQTNKRTEEEVKKNITFTSGFFHSLQNFCKCLLFAFFYFSNIRLSIVKYKQRKQNDLLPFHIDWPELEKKKRKHRQHAKCIYWCKMVCSTHRQCTDEIQTMCVTHIHTASTVLIVKYLQHFDFRHAMNSTSNSFHIK